MWHHLRTKSFLLSLFFHLIILFALLIFIHLHHTTVYEISGHKKITHAYFVSTKQIQALQQLTQHKEKQTKSLKKMPIKNKVHTKKSTLTKTTHTIQHATQKKQMQAHHQIAQNKAITGNTLNQLIQLIYQQIDAHKTYPEQAKAMHQQGKVLIKFILMPDGKLNNITLAQSSGFRLLDTAALATVQAASPIPHVARYLNSAQEFTIPIGYHLN
ncbi:MAG: hypothetical protein CMF49_09525 [Legionellales bacterium]|nr:hypothetical protein [Legionellales bacterium]|tara:strand:- start:1158 stop:1799 length:642 start_codon:yes stop_codon:yes gene_type:complete